MWTAIKDLNPSTSNQFYNVKGKVIQVFGTEVWQSPKHKTSGLKLSFTLSDGSDIIYCTAWRDVCQLIEPSIKSGQHIELKNVSVNFQELKNRKVINLNKFAIVTPFSPRFHFKPFKRFDNLKYLIGKKVDVFGTITLISTTDLDNKDLILKDNENRKINVSLKNKTAQHFGGSLGNRVAVKNGVVVNGNLIKSVTKTNCVIEPKVEPTFE